MSLDLTLDELCAPDKAKQRPPPPPPPPPAARLSDDADRGRGRTGSVFSRLGGRPAHSSDGGGALPNRKRSYEEAAGSSSGASGSHRGSTGPAGERLDEEGYLWWNEATGVCTYYTDRRRKWPFRTSRKGKELLVRLVDANAALRRRNLRLLSRAGDPDAVAAAGERLYVDKPTLRGDANVTWSFDEYGHPGLQLYYLKLKSWQRFVETYALLERAGRRGVFDAPPPSGRPLRFVALGGGPGYELLAVQHFFAADNSAPALELINTDIQPTWREYSEELGFKFHVFDITAGGLSDVVGVGAIDYVIVSYVLIYVAKTPGHPQHEAVCDEFKRMLDGGVRAILVSERSEQTPACRMMEARGVRVERLMDQSLGNDERQSLFLSREATPLPKPPPPRSADAKLIFPNVPFEEHKIKRGGAVGAGGSQTRWYS